MQNVNWLTFFTKIDNSHSYVLHHTLDGMFWSTIDKLFKHSYEGAN